VDARRLTVFRSSRIGFVLGLGVALWLLPGQASADECQDGECTNGHPYQTCECLDDSGAATCKYFVVDGQQFDCAPVNLPSGGLDFDCQDAQAMTGQVCCQYGGDFCGDGSNPGSGSGDPGGASDGGTGGDAGSSEGGPSSGETTDPPRDDCATPPDPVTTDPPGLCGDVVCRQDQICCEEECQAADQECTLVPSRFGPGRGRFATGCSAAGGPGEGWAGTMVVAAALLWASRRRRSASPV
jgi:uncharacterized protein (TIGR03382 family)